MSLARGTDSKRPQQAGLALLDQGGHAGEPIGPARPRGAHGHGLGLVVGVMGDQQMQDAVTPASLEQQAIARLARGFLQPACRLGAAPAQDLCGDAVASEQIARPRRLAGGFAAQAVIDDQADDPALQLGGPFMRQQRERERIAAARHGNGKNGTGFERRERRHQRRELGARERLGGGAHPQPFFWRSWSMRRFCKSVARG